MAAGGTAVSGSGGSTRQRTHGNLCIRLTTWRVRFEKSCGVNQAPATRFDTSPSVGIGRDDGGHVAHGEPLLHGEHPGQDQLARVAADDGRADDQAALADDRLDEAFGRALGLGAVVLLERPLHRFRACVLELGLRLGPAHVRKFGLRVGDPGHGPVIHLGRQIEERIADDDAGVIAGHVRELEAASNVADGKDALVGRAQPVIDLDAGRAIFDVCRLEPEADDVGTAPRGDEQMRAFDPLGA